MTALNLPADTTIFSNHGEAAHCADCNNGAESDDWSYLVTLVSHTPMRWVVAVFDDEQAHVGYL